MNSCLYKAHIMHHRLAPKQHRFHYRVYLFCIDLDELPMLSRKILMLSHNRFNFFSFRDREHLQLPAEAPDTGKTIRQHITDYLQQNGIFFTGGQILLLTNLNVLGYNFNPVSFYFCFDETGSPVCCVVEVSNTFREMKPYLMGPESFSEEGFRRTVKKYFYVSPFIDHDTEFDFNVAVPGEKLAIRIYDYQEGRRFFISTLTGRRKALTNARLLGYSIRFPFITLKVIALIHWNALVLWLKKLPARPKRENRHLQKDVYRRYKENI
ncbi:MAG: DUF1365 domain-containing protein [Puia sp.]|nr:DUF1365 domain-containing protein [Puia sp.]